MRRDPYRRLAQLEEKAGILLSPLPIVFFHFTNDDATVPNFAECDGAHWKRDSHETATDFKGRIAHDITMSGSRGIVVLLSDDSPLRSHAP